MSGVVWLVGMMGAGKSAVGAALARRLGRPFVDADARIEQAAGRSIARIFAEDGEPAFRRLERQALDALAGSDAVVALGGGAIAQPGAAERLAATGLVVYLRARPETLAARIEEQGGAEARPLLAGLSPEARVERLRELLAARAAAYASAAVALDTDALDVEAAAEELERRVRQREAQAAGGGAARPAEARS